MNIPKNIRKKFIPKNKVKKNDKTKDVTRVTMNMVER